MTSPEKAIDKLQECGINPSVQRLTIMDYLLNHPTHPTAEEVYVALVPSLPTLSRTTVYNTLRLFSEHGAARMLTIDERKVCFDGCMEPHAHFLCRCCGRLSDMPLPADAGRAADGESAHGCRIEEVHYYYKGLCPDCRAADEKTL